MLPITRFPDTALVRTYFTGCDSVAVSATAKAQRVTSVEGASGAITITAPDARKAIDALFFAVADGDASASSITVVDANSATFNGQANFSISAHGGATFVWSVVQQQWLVAGAVGDGAIVQHTQTFTTVGDNAFVVPADAVTDADGFVEITYEMWGGGGGGGGGGGNGYSLAGSGGAAPGGGGGGGASLLRGTFRATLGQTAHVVLGGGGLGGAHGDSSIPPVPGAAGDPSYIEFNPGHHRQCTAPAGSGGLAGGAMGAGAVSFGGSSASTRNVDAYNYALPNPLGVRLAMQFGPPGSGGYGGLGDQSGEASTGQGWGSGVALLAVNIADGIAHAGVAGGLTQLGISGGGAGGVGGLGPGGGQSGSPGNGGDSNTGGPGGNAATPADANSGHGGGGGGGGGAAGESPFDGGDGALGAGGFARFYWEQKS